MAQLRQILPRVLLSSLMQRAQVARPLNRSIAMLAQANLKVTNKIQVNGNSLSDRPLLRVASAMTGQIVHSSHKMPLTYDYIRERILLVLRLYDKIDPDKLTLDSHFYNDLGLDSLDHVELIMAIEDEFQFEIPDVDAERLNTPNEILKYISIKEEIYPELEHPNHSHEGHH